jgi:adenylyltransferase/sulfurtransferase
MDETPVIVEFLNKQIPLSEIDTRATEIEKDIVVVFCQSGVRSKKAVAVLAGIFGESKKIYSLKGGITGWKSQTIKPV